MFYAYIRPCIVFLANGMLRLPFFSRRDRDNCLLLTNAAFFAHSFQAFARIRGCSNKNEVHRNFYLMTLRYSVNFKHLNLVFFSKYAIDNFSRVKHHLLDLRLSAQVFA